MANRILTIMITGLLSFNISASECDDDYVKHHNEVLQLITSINTSDSSLGEAQRDCLSLALQESKSMCDTFRTFQDEFMIQTKNEQIKQGKQCFSLLAK